MGLGHEGNRGSGEPVNLLDIPYGRAPEQDQGSFERVGKAVKDALDTSAKGFYAYGQERVRSQLAEAKTSLALGLKKLHTELNSRNYVTADELRNAFEGNVPPGLRLVDDFGDESLDRQQIPIHEVASQVYAYQAKRLVEAASKKVEVPGWEAEFRAEADDLVLKGHHELVGEQLKSMHEEQVRTTMTTLQGQLSAGLYLDARKGVRGSAVLPQAQKDQLLQHVDETEQMDTYFRFLTRGVRSSADVLEAGELLSKLKSGDGTSAIEEKNRTSLARAVREAVRAWEAESKRDEHKAFQQADEEASNAVFGFLRSRSPQSVTYAEVIKRIPKVGTISHQMHEHLFNVAKSYARDDAKLETNPFIYQQIVMSADDVDNFKQGLVSVTTEPGKPAKLVPLLSLSNHVSKEHMLRFIDLQRTLREQGLAAMKGFISDEELVKSILSGPEFKYDLKTSDVEKQADIGNAMIQASLALASQRPSSAADRYAVATKAIRGAIKKKSTAFGLWTWKENEVREAGIDPEWWSVFSASVPGVTPAAAKPVFESYRQWEPGLEKAWRARTGKRYLPLETAQAIHAFITYAPGAEVTPPVIAEIEKELEATNPATGKPFKELPPAQLQELRAALGVVKFLRASGR